MSFRPQSTSQPSVKIDITTTWECAVCGVTVKAADRGPGYPIEPASRYWKPGFVAVYCSAECSHNGHAPYMGA